MKRLMISLIMVLVMISVLLPTTSVSASNGLYTRVFHCSGSIEEGAAIVIFKGQVVKHWQGWGWGYEVNWKVNFQNVNNDDLDGAEFTSTSIISLSILTLHRVKLVAEGRLTGEDWSKDCYIDVRMQDNGEPGKGRDTIRIILYEVSTEGINYIYDTYDNKWWDPPQYGYIGDFPDEDEPIYPVQGWKNNVRTKLDSGNIKFE